LVLTHFSARYQDINVNKKSRKGSIQEIEDEAKHYYSGNLSLANDFDQYHLDVNGQLSLKK